VWLTGDAGQSWERGNAGLVPRYLPGGAQDGAIPLCVHHLERVQTDPQRMYMQFHGGVYRSDDAGRSWSDIGGGLPSDFGFPIVADPADRDRAFVIPLEADTDRVTPGGRVSVWETTDAGATWIERNAGLPSSDAYLTIFRQAFTRSGDGASLELYFGATSGTVFGSGDGGQTWSQVATHLPPVLAVRAS
jgi:photosystem II stability/assembly factor-like uncharacterized protein